MADSMPPVIPEVPQEVMDALQGILEDVYGKDVRQDIVTALSWHVGYVSQIAQFINDLGLTVKNGKLCVIFNQE